MILKRGSSWAVDTKQLAPNSNAPTLLCLAHYTLQSSVRLESEITPTLDGTQHTPTPTNETIAYYIVAVSVI